VTSLRIAEIFLSIQGESRTAGWPTVFIRLTGCPLRCTWCDTSYAFSGGNRLSLEEILERVREYGVRRVCVTGGEPLAQPSVHGLLDALIADEYDVSLETSGALDISRVDPRISRVVDIKAPGSGEMVANRYENIAILTPHDQVKFVLLDEADYRWAVEMVKTHDLESRCEVLFSPVADQLSPVWLAEQIIKDRLNVRFQLQLHKILWGGRQGV
jgi:7-carboxy-7-deazaguanine synthase